MITAVIRLSDGLLADIQVSPNLPSDDMLRLANAVTQFGGTFANWQLVMVPEALWEGIDPKARQYASVDGGGAIIDVLEVGPPTIDSDKSSIVADGVDTITISVDVGDAGYTGAVDWQVIAPDETVTEVADNAVAGIDTWAFAVTQVGEWLVVAETEAHGSATLSFTATGG
jgi:hypothetical protein